MHSFQVMLTDDLTTYVVLFKILLQTVTYIDNNDMVSLMPDTLNMRAVKP